MFSQIFSRKIREGSAVGFGWQPISHSNLSNFVDKRRSTPRSFRRHRQEIVLIEWGQLVQEVYYIFLMTAWDIRQAVKDPLNYEFVTNHYAFINSTNLNEEVVISNAFIKRRLEASASWLQLNSTPNRATFDPFICVMIKKSKTSSMDTIVAKIVMGLSWK